MKIDKKSLVLRLLVPVLGAIVLISVILLLFVSRITRDVIDDYYQASLASYSDEARRILATAIAELSTARLLDNRAVTEAKQRSVIEALSLNWKARGIEGIITGPDGAVIHSTLPEAATAGIIGLAPDGHFHVVVDHQELRGQAVSFAPWRWRVLVLTRDLPGQTSRKEVLSLVPLVGLGSFFMIAMLFFIFQRRLQHPVAAMVDDVRSERKIAPTGVTEFDQVGAAINDALERVQERTTGILAKEERIRLLLASTAEGIYGVDTQGTCTFCNPAGLRMLGYEREQDVLGKNIHALIHHSYPDGSTYPEQECVIYSAYQVGRGVHGDREVFWRKDGSSFPIEYWSYPVYKDGGVTGAVVTFIDITERRRAEAELRAERNKFEAIIAAIGEGISIQDRDFRVLYQNEVHRNLAGPHVGDLCHEAYRSLPSVCGDCPLARAFADGRVHSAERVLEGPDGIRHIEITSSPLRDASGAIVAGIELVRDVTDRWRTESQLRQAQKMEAVGQLAGGIAHDFNNMLTAIVGYASLLKKNAASGSENRLYAEQILGSAERAANLTRQILAFSRKQVLSRRPVVLNHVVGSMEKLIARVLGEDIDIRFSLADADTTVAADPGQLEQVVMNLCTNARDAMPSGGRLAVTTAVVEIGADAAPKAGLAQGGRYAVLSIADSGTGMDAQTRERIFEPFFTTKETGRGTGLGLSIAYGIVKQHNGQITVTSEPGRGTTFRIHLPLAGQAAEASARKEEAAVRGGTETLLIAEDNKEVRELARTVLEEHGYQVVTAADGEEAVQRFLDHQDEIALCLVDLIMPKRNGKDAVAAMRRARPELKVVYMSGYSADIIRERDIAEVDAAFLSKPLLPQDLLRTVRDVLDA